MKEPILTAVLWKGVRLRKRTPTAVLWKDARQRKRTPTTAPSADASTTPYTLTPAALQVIELLPPPAVIPVVDIILLTEGTINDACDFSINYKLHIFLL